MDFSYLYKDDPDYDELRGNITWIIPDFETPAHWIHAEMTCKWMRDGEKRLHSMIVLLELVADEGIYNTYILDTDYKSWTLIMHCAEKAKSTRYLSALLLSRERELGINVINYLRWPFRWFRINLFDSNVDVRLSLQGKITGVRYRFVIYVPNHTR